MDECIILSLMPKAKLHGNLLFDIIYFHAAVFLSKNAGHENQWVLGVPLALVYSSELGGHEANDFHSYLSFGWQVELVWVCHHRVIPGLPYCVIVNAPIKVPAIVLVDGVTVYFP